MKSLGVRAAAVACALLVLSACTPEPGPQPSPTPSLTASPPESETQRRERVAYEAAEAAYRRESAEMDRLLAAGGRDGATPELEAVAAGPYLKDELFVLRNYQRDKQRAIGEVQIHGFQRKGYSPSELLMEVCADGAAVTTLDKSGKVIQKGVVARLDLTFRLINTKWKIWSAALQEGKKCD